MCYLCFPNNHFLKYDFKPFLVCQCQKQGDCRGGLTCDGCNCVKLNDPVQCTHCAPGSSCDPLTGACVRGKPNCNHYTSIGGLNPTCKYCTYIIHNFNPHSDVLTTDVPYFDVTINNHITDKSAPTKASATTTAPNRSTSSITPTSSANKSINKTTTTVKPTKAHSHHLTSSTTMSGAHDQNTDSTNKRMTTANPNNTATKGYKLENSTDDDTRLTTIQTLNVATSTTEVSIKNTEPLFMPIIIDTPPTSEIFTPILSLPEILKPNYSISDPLSHINHPAILKETENMTVVCYSTRDCPSNAICVYGYCKTICGPLKTSQCFSGTSVCKYLV